MQKGRKSKYILIVVMALVLVMAFSSIAFAGVNGSTVTASDILSAFSFLEDDILKAKWAPNNSPYINAPVSAINTLYYRDGFAICSSFDFERVRSYLIGHSLGQDYEWYIYTVTGIDDLFSRVYVDDSPSGNKQSINVNAKLRAIEYFKDKTISYFYNATLGYVLCNFANQPILSVSDYTEDTQKEVANIPIQAAGDTVLNNDNRNYYYDNTSTTNKTEIYEGDSITYEGDTIINEGDTIETNTYYTGDTIHGDVVSGDQIQGDLIDLNGGTINMPTGDIYQIEDYIYNEDNDTYYYSTTNNNQTYNFTVQYFYEYTYVIYLGSSEEYKPEAYKFYYELPDGRSSADLTVDELAGMSVQFNDVVTYDRAASDDVVQGLWHLDGSIENSAYNPNAEMYFNSGASISYQDASNFEGALYLPALTGAREWYNDLGYSTENGTVVPTEIIDYYNSIFGGTNNVQLSSSSKPHSLSLSESFNYSVDFRFYSYAAENDSTGTMFTYQPYFNGFGSYYDSTKRYVFNKTLSMCNVDFLGTKIKFYNNSNTATSISISPGVWNHLLINYSLSPSSSSDYYDGYQYYYYYDLSIDAYLNGVLVYSTSAPSVLSNVVRPSDRSSYKAYFYTGNRCGSGLAHVKFSSTSNTVPFMLDEIRITSANVPNLVSPVPYEDNLVWVLPDSTNLAANTLAIQSEYLSGKYRVGGIRPSMVEKGHVWFQIENNRIISCQVYNGIVWQEVHCYVSTGSRWIPASYYDVVTLTDYYDIADNTGLPTITTNEGFFAWFQREFKELKDKIFSFFDNYKPSEGGSSSTTVIAPSINADGSLNVEIAPDIDVNVDVGTSATDLLKNGIDGISGIFRGAWSLFGFAFNGITDSITGFFDFFTPDFENNPMKSIHLWLMPF